MSKTEHLPRNWRVEPKRSHPWAITTTTNVPGVRAEVCTVSFRPYARHIGGSVETARALRALYKAYGSPRNDGGVWDAARRALKKGGWIS